jgi:hypothetical protein
MDATTTAAGDGRLNVEAELRRLNARLATVEGILAVRAARRKCVAAPRPDDAIIAGRVRLWDRFVLLQVGHGPTTKLHFVVKHHLGDAAEFRRFFSATDKRGIPEGSAPALRFYQALNDAIAELEARSHGKDSHSHFSGLLPQ